MPFFKLYFLACYYKIAIKYISQYSENVSIKLNDLKKNGIVSIMSNKTENIKNLW